MLGFATRLVTPHVIFNLLSQVLLQSVTHLVDISLVSDFLFFFHLDLSLVLQIENEGTKQEDDADESALRNGHDPLFI